MADALWGNVYFKDTYAGRLQQEPGGWHVFTYDDSYVGSDQPPIAHTLPLRHEPYVSERGEKDIQLSTISSILRVLGMLDERRLDFPTDEVRYDSWREVVAFVGVDRKKGVDCAISRESS